MTSEEIKAKLLEALVACGGNRTHAARLLGISRQHMHRLMGCYLTRKILRDLDRAQEVATFAK